MKILKCIRVYLKTLIIRQKYLPSDHFDLRQSDNNIGNIYYHRDHHYHLALEHLNLSLKISKKSLSLQHPDTASIPENIGLVYEDKCEFQIVFS